jgi:hypothetical protein
MKAPLALSLVGAVLLGGVIYFEEDRISDLKKQLTAHQAHAADLTGKLSKLKNEVDELQRRLKDSNALKEQLQTKLNERGNTIAEATSSTPTPETKENSGAKWMKGIAKMFTDPEMRKTMRSQQMVGIRMMYGDLAKELDLSPQDAEQLLEILTDRQMEMAAAGMQAFDRNNPDQAKDKDRLAESTKRYEDQIQAMLGEEKFKSLKTYEGSMGDRFMLQQFEGQFGAAGAPLVADQKQKLLDLMRDERAKTPSNMNLANSGNPVQQMDALKNPEKVNQFVTSQQEYQKRVLDRSRQFLNADQVGALEKVHKQQLELLQMQMKMSREMLGIDK